MIRFRIWFWKHIAEFAMRKYWIAIIDRMFDTKVKPLWPDLAAEYSERVKKNPELYGRVK